MSPDLTCLSTNTYSATSVLATIRQTHPKATIAIPIFDLEGHEENPRNYSQAEAGWRLVGSEARIFGVAAMLDIGRISVRGSIKAHSSIYRRHQRSARTKPALLCLVPEHGRADSGWRWRTVLADSDGLAIAPQDTIHLPDHGTSPQCVFNAKA